MKQSLAPATPKFPDNPPAPDADDADFEPESATLGQRFATWLKHFVLYLGAVMTACAFGLYFLWRLPIPQEAAQLLGSASDSPRSRSLATIVAPPPARSPSAPAVVAPPVAPDSPPIAAPPSPPTATDPGLTETAVPTAPLAETPAEESAPPPPQAEIDQLLAEAQQQMESRRLTAPAGGNALRSYQRVLELEADNSAALEGLERIAAYYRDIAEQTRQQGRLEESLAYVGRGLQASPKNERLLNLRREIRLARQREQEQRQARVEEARRQQAERDEQNQLRQRMVEPQQPWWRQPPPSANDSGFNQR